MKQYNFSITVSLTDDLDSATVAIGGDHNPVYVPALIVATEHLMTMAGMTSALPFDEALKLLVDGATKNHIIALQRQAGEGAPN